jgi:cation-transporting ATPase 13A3/4/5
VICFDKTGTLTTDNMKLKGSFDVKSMENKEECSSFSSEIKICLSVCHSLTLYENKLLGDPQEIALLDGIGWERGLTDNGRITVFNPETLNWIISKFTYHFSPEIKRMGVVIEENGKNVLYMKGAPEVIMPLCRNYPNGMYEVFISLTRQGYRVLACARKELESFDENDKLEDIEQGLQLIGFPYLENPLKSDTIDTIKALRKARIECFISTGDNMLTGLAVGRTLNLITSNTIYIGDCIGGDIIWEDHEGKRILEFPENLDYEVVMSGSLLEKIIKEKVEYTFLIQSRCKIFGRMTPNNKIMLVKFFQQGETMVAMVGDGANDCGALKQADVGLSLSEAEASIAAPFSSKELSSIIYLLREGRCALASSFQSFKFMMLYSVIQFSNTVMCYWLQTNLTNNQFIYQDFFNVMPCVFTVAASLPYKKLSKRMPPGSLLSIPIITSVTGVIILAVGITLSSYLLMDPCFDWYSEGNNGSDFDVYDVSDSGYIGDIVEDDDGDMVKSSIYYAYATVYGNVIFLQGTLQLVVICTVFSIGRPFREPIYKNIGYMVSVVILMAFNIFFIFDRSDFPYKFIDLWDDHHMDYRWMMFGIFWAGSLLTYLYEKFMVPVITRCCRRMIRNRVFQN